MMVIDGNALAEELQASIEGELQILRLSGVKPGLATVIVGEDYGRAGLRTPHSPPGG